MPESRRLPSRRDIPWEDVRRSAKTVYRWLINAWNELPAEERDEIRKLLTKSRGRLRNLTKDEAKRLGQLASRAATAGTRRRS